MSACNTSMLQAHRGSLVCPAASPNGGPSGACWAGTKPTCPHVGTVCPAAGDMPGSTSLWRPRCPLTARCLWAPSCSDASLGCAGSTRSACTRGSARCATPGLRWTSRGGRQRCRHALMQHNSLTGVTLAATGLQSLRLPPVCSLFCAALLHPASHVASTSFLLDVTHSSSRPVLVV